MAKDPKNANCGQKPNKIILSRTLFLMVVCGIVTFIVLAARLYQVQIIDHEYYEQLAVEQQTRETTVTASRGTIFDANGKVLAISATAETVYISPYEMELYGEDPDLIATGLSEILNVDYDKIIEKTKDTSSWYKTIRTKIESDLADEVRAFITENDLKSIHLETDTKRYYPYSSLACHILGFVGTDNYGLQGLEAVYDDYLTGVNGRIIRMKNGEGTNMLFTNFEDYYDAEDGDNITLTLDVTIQYYAEKYLNQAIEDYDVQNGGSCIIMNVNTGEILAMASRTSYDPNNYLTVSDEVQEQLDTITDSDEYNTELVAAQYKQWWNKAISDSYEPGSVFKIITLATALDEGIVDTNDTFYCSGSMDVLGRTTPLNCWKTSGHGTQTLAQAAQNSCNVAFATIGLRIGAETFYKYAHAFGLFDKTGIDLPGEGEDQWWTDEVFYNKDNLSQLAAASFGQTFTITPIQLITAVSAVANGGYLMKPYIVKEITDQDGNVLVANEPTVVRQVISEETSDTVNEILESVVTEGTGKNAYVAGYRIAGKTGTSEKVSESLTSDEDEYIVSFLGYAPADDPQIAVLFILDTPSNDTGYYISGGNMAGPLSRRNSIGGSAIPGHRAGIHGRGSGVSGCNGTQCRFRPSGISQERT